MHALNNANPKISTNVFLCARIFEYLRPSSPVQSKRPQLTFPMIYSSASPRCIATLWGVKGNLRSFNHFIGDLLCKRILVFAERTFSALIKSSIVAGCGLVDWEYSVLLRQFHKCCQILILKSQVCLLIFGLYMNGQPGNFGLVMEKWCWKVAI